MKRIVSLLLTLAFLMACVPAVSVPASAEEDTLMSIEMTVDADLASNDELFAAYAQSVLYGIDYSPHGIAAGQRLSGDEKVLYDALVPVIKDIAAGKRSSTAIAIGQAGYTVDVEATFTGGMLSQESMRRLVSALLTDLPYEMYWFDKTTGYSYTWSDSVPLQYIQLRFTVAENYAGSQDYTIDTAKAGAAVAAAANAQSVVNSLASKSDYEKLVGYKDAICNMVSYNYDAAHTGVFAENDDPWQLIYVFDGNSTTNVVCEGYSKAFMYLCDLTDFDGDVTCCTVSGAMNGGGHMWNIVTIEGKNYLVDVTNSDEGTIGSAGGVFLAGATGNSTTGYTLHGITYTYDSKTQNLWGTDADSILTMATEDYTPGAGTDPTPDYIDSGECGDNLTWTLDADGTLTISGTGAMADWSFGWDDYRDSIKTVVIEDGVTSIGGNAFLDCINLVSISIPDGVTTFKYLAFAHCSNLTEITIPETVTSIEFQALSATGCTSIHIPASVTDIDYTAFGCMWTHYGGEGDGSSEKLIKISVDANNPNYSCDAQGALYNKDMTKLIRCPNGVSGEFVVPNSVTEIGTSAFNYCEKITDIRMHDGITVINQEAFMGCKGLQSITLPQNITNLSYGTFASCTALTEIVIPKNVTHIADGIVFYNCRSLTTVIFEGNAPEIVDNAFEGVTATCYYPAGDPTWTDEVKQPCGGTLTWVAKYAIIDSGKCGDNLTWMLDENGTLIISGTGDMWDWSYSSSAPWHSNRLNIKSLVVEAGVTSIGDYAFLECRSLTSITLSEGITSIGDSAFADCRSLTSLTLSEGITSIGDSAFANCSNLKNITLPDGITSIGADAFNNCSSLTSIKLPKDITSIASFTFADCRSLTSLTLSEGITSIGDSAFSCCSSLTSITLPKSLASIGDYAFSCCSSLTSITLPKSLASIGDYAFSECNSLTSLTLSEGLTSIGDSAFSECSSLTSLALPEGITSIGADAFNNCSKLASLTLPESLTSIGDSAFEACSSLTSLTLPDGITSIGNYAFRNCSSLTSLTVSDGITGISNYAFQGCNIENLTIAEGSKTVTSTMVIGKSTLEEVVIPDSVTSIGNYAFSDCRYLTSITIPDSVTSIGNYAFQGCSIKKLTIAEGAKTVTPTMVVCESTLEEVVIPDSVTSIGDSAFAECRFLTDITLPESLISIGDSVFSECRSLTSLTLPDGITSIGADAFYNCISLESLMLPNSIASIGDWALWSCINLMSITLPESLTSIGDYAFESCSMTSITLPDSITSIGDNAFAYCSRLASITLSESLTSIGEYAFSNCYSLTSIEIPIGVTSIGEGTFESCESLTSIALPAGMTSIGEDAFESCESLSSITLPASVTSIADNVFWLCSSLRSITFEGSAPDIREYAFDDVTAICYYPAGDPTWTDDMKQDYGGTLTWKTVCDEHDWTAATCTAPKTCKICGEEDGDALGHSYKTVVTAPTCTATGYTTYTCHCGDIFVSGTTKAQGHAYTNQIKDAAYRRLKATKCTEFDTYWYGCSRCDANAKNDIKATDKFWVSEDAGQHSFTEEMIDAAHLVVGSGSSCQSAKQYYYDCAYCAEIGTATWSSDTYGDHDLKHIDKQEATCAADGHKEYWQCQIDGCDQYFSSEDNKIADLADWLAGEGKLARLSHNFVEGKCKYCGAEDAVPGDLDGNGEIDNKDVEYLLWYTLFPESYPIEGDADFNNDGSIDNQDVEYLLWHTLFPESYPLTV